MSVKVTLRCFIPPALLGAYHYAQSCLAMVVYGYPARRLIVIGITGTKGKSTTSGMLWHILREQKIRVGLVSTAQISTGGEPILNSYKMTMPSPFTLQRLMRRMLGNGCTHVVVETSSEGLSQWRHIGLPYQVAVFTNLTPEHLEAHGSLANYQAAKARLFAVVARRGGTSVINLDDPLAPFFLSFPAKRKIGFTLHSSTDFGLTQHIAAQVITVAIDHAVFAVDGAQVSLAVGGTFNIANALAALAAAWALGFALPKSAQALATFKGVPGRLEFVRAGQPFHVIVDYAHTTESLEAVYALLKPKSGRLLVVLGSCGGGRDKAKREPLGKLAGTYADLVYVTNEDPYDEDPMLIMQTVAQGTRSTGKIVGQDLWIISDRREAIAEAIKAARPGDTVVITGKGAEQWLCVAGNKKIPWDDRTVVREELSSIAH